MQIINRFLFSLLLIVLSSAATNAKDWRGITPLHSTRDDVRRLLGPPAEENEIRSKYELETEDVYIVFSNEWSHQKYAIELPTGTVLLIQVTPKAETHLSENPFDQQKLIDFDPSDPPNIGYKGYIDEEQGIVMRTLNGTIEEINYIAAREDRKLCPEYYEESKKFARIIVYFRGKNRQGKVDSSDNKSQKQKSIRKP